MDTQRQSTLTDTETSARQAAYTRARVFRASCPTGMYPEGHYLVIYDSEVRPYLAPGFPPVPPLLEVEADRLHAVQHSLAAEASRRGVMLRDHCEVLMAPARIARCRLYRLTCRLTSVPAQEFTEVWDHEDAPFEATGDMPTGELIATESSYSTFLLRQQMRPHLDCIGIRAAASWGSCRRA